MEQLGFHLADFNEIWYLSIFRKSAEKIHVSLKSDKNNRYFTWIPIYVYDHTSRLFLLRTRNFLRKSLYRKSKHTNTYFGTKYGRTKPDVPAATRPSITSIHRMPYTRTVYLPAHLPCLSTANNSRTTSCSNYCNYSSTFDNILEYTSFSTLILTRFISPFHVRNNANGQIRGLEL